MEAFMRIVGDEVVDALEERLEHHEKCRYAYVRWRCPSDQNARSALIEKHIRPPVFIDTGDQQITWEQRLRFEEAHESRDGKAHVIYRSVVMVDGQKKDIRTIKKVLEKQLARNAADAMRKAARRSV